MTTVNYLKIQIINEMDFLAEITTRSKTQKVLKKYCIEQYMYVIPKITRDYTILLRPIVTYEIETRVGTSRIK